MSGVDIVVVIKLKNMENFKISEFQIRISLSDDVKNQLAKHGASNSFTFLKESQKHIEELASQTIALQLNEWSKSKLKNNTSKPVFYVHFSGSYERSLVLVGGLVSLYSAYKLVKEIAGLPKLLEGLDQVKNIVNKTLFKEVNEHFKHRLSDEYNINLTNSLVKVNYEYTPTFPIVETEIIKQTVYEESPNQTSKKIWKTLTLINFILLCFILVYTPLSDQKNNNLPLNLEVIVNKQNELINKNKELSDSQSLLKIKMRERDSVLRVVLNETRGLFKRLGYNEK